jgi:antitoxin (DNA-binding transcriptional repressor) of toxin-antitoxin stability system
LSTYIGYATQGEEVVETDHGREVALLVPITPERTAVMGLVAEGDASWSGGKPVGLTNVRSDGEPLSANILAERKW